MRKAGDPAEILYETFLLILIYKNNDSINSLQNQIRKLWLLGVLQGLNSYAKKWINGIGSLFWYAFQTSAYTYEFCISSVTIPNLDNDQAKEN